MLRHEPGGTPMSETEIDRLVDQLAREYDGDPWHGSPLLQLLDGVDHRAACARPIPGGHTIWELVLHMTAWKNETRRRLGGAPAGEPLEGDWPPPAGTGAADWRNALDSLGEAHRALLAAVEQLTEAQLFAPTSDPRNRETGEGVTFYVLLHGIVQHDVYHSGQIALLKKSLP
jgi:uncharacterized damage-inducible protein DinB